MQYGANYTGRSFQLIRAHYEDKVTIAAGSIGVARAVDLKSLSLLLEFTGAVEPKARVWVAEGNVLLVDSPPATVSGNDTPLDAPAPKPLPPAERKYKTLREYQPKLIVVKSSNIKALGHVDGGLVVEFTNGTGYIYPGVSADVVNDLIGEPSIGKAFNTRVKNNDDYTAVKLEA